MPHLGVPRTRKMGSAPRNSVSSVFETVLSEIVCGPSLHVKSGRFVQNHVAYESLVGFNNASTQRRAPCVGPERQSWFGQRLRGGQNVSREFWGGGGKRTAECALQNHFWRPQKLGLVWVGASFFKAKDRESPKEGGGKRVVCGGSKNVFGEGFYAEFTVCFPPP